MNDWKSKCCPGLVGWFWPLDPLIPTDPNNSCHDCKHCDIFWQLVIPELNFVSDKAEAPSGVSCVSGLLEASTTWTCVIKVSQKQRSVFFFRCSPHSEPFHSSGKVAADIKG